MTETAMPELHDARMAALLIDVLAMLCGTALGTVFYGGLWWTVRHLATSSRPALAVFISLLLRMGVALGGFYLVGRGDWVRLLSCLLGFLLARVAVTWLTRRWAAEPIAPLTGMRHAP
jgi:F1F0 ATPase subunit 2